jgi:hypothetical protein
MNGLPLAFFGYFSIFSKYLTMSSKVGRLSGSKIKQLLTIFLKCLLARLGGLSLSPKYPTIADIYAIDLF